MVDNTELLQRIEKLEKQVELLQAEITAMKNIEVSEKAREQIDRMERANKLVSLMESLSGEKMPDAQKNEELEVLHNISQQAEIEVQSSMGAIEKFIDNSADESDFEWQPYQDGVEITKYVGMSKKTVVTPSKINGQKVVSIARQAFKGCIEIEKVIVSNGVINIGNGAFMNCTKLKEINLPQTLKYIGSENINERIGMSRTAFNYNNRFEGAFESTKLENVAIPNLVEFIGPYTFHDCSQLKSVVLPENLQILKVESFGMCPLLDEIIFPKYLREIENDVFSSQVIEEVFLPESVVKIGRGAFFYCKNLRRIYIPNNSTEIGDGFPRGRDDFTILCNPGSYAMKYAREHQINCEKFNL